VPVDVSFDVKVVENLTEEEELQPSPVREVDRLSDLGAIGDDFDEEGYYDEDAMYDTISKGSEDDGVAIGDEVEADLTSYDDMSDDLLKGEEHRSDPSSEDETECREAGFHESLRAPVDGSLRMELNDAKRRMLMAVHVEVPSVPNCMDISMVDEAVCDTGLSMLEDEVPESGDMEIKTGMVFDTLEHVKYFL
jgi:hypothetical protein